VARLCSFQNNPANVKFPFMARTYDKNAQIDKALCLY